MFSGFKNQCFRYLLGAVLLLVSGQVYAQSLQESIKAAQNLYKSSLRSSVAVKSNPYAEFPKIRPEVFSPGKRPSQLLTMEYEVTRTGGLFANPGRYAVMKFEEDEDLDHQKIIAGFNGYRISIRFVPECVVRIENVSEEHLESVWRHLSGSPLGPTLNDIVKAGRYLNLSDWSMVNFVEAFSDSVFEGPEMRKESVMLQVFLLHSLGFRVCLAHDEAGNLYRLISSDAALNGTREFYEDGVPYSLFGGSDNLKLSLCFFDGHGKYPVSMAINPDEIFYSEYGDTRRFVSDNYPELSVSVPVNTVLKNFYGSFPIYHTNDNPLTEFYYRASANMPREIVEAVYPTLAAALNGKSHVDALNMLLDFVQTAFIYEIDNDRWEGERFFFPGEIWYHDVCDCDDKAILFSRLVRDIMKLDVALVFWPGHLSCAVETDEPLAGYMYDVSGRKYVSCDPTMPGARVGDVMETLKDKKASLIIL